MPVQISTSQYNWIYLLSLEAKWALQNSNKKGREEADSDGSVRPQCECWELWECPIDQNLQFWCRGEAAHGTGMCVGWGQTGPVAGAVQELESSSVGAPRCGEIPAKCSAGGLHRPSKCCVASWNVAVVLITTWILQVYPFVIKICCCIGFAWQSVCSLRLLCFCSFLLTSWSVSQLSNSLEQHVGGIMGLL